MIHYCQKGKEEVCVESDNETNGFQLLALWRHPQVYNGPCETPLMDFFADIVNTQKPLIIFAKTRPYILHLTGP